MIVCQVTKARCRAPWIILWAVLAFALLLSCNKGQSNKDSIKVAAASDLSQAFKEVGAEFEKDTGKKVTFSFGSTGLLSKQIIEGAPFDLFAAANVSFVDEVVAAGNCDKSSQELYARGRLVVWTPKGTKAPESLADLADPAFAKVAIANPEHAPYGKAAKEALVHEKLWDQLDGQKRIVIGENVSQTLQYAESGNADAAIVALSLVIGGEGHHIDIDQSLHAPLDQALVVCGKGPKAETAREFARYVNGEKGRGIMRRYGFLLPSETSANASH